MKRLPPWIRSTLKTDAGFGGVQDLLAANDLHTVCKSAHCPNRHECWNAGTATFMILGDVCTRNCSFCAVAHGEGGELDPGEADALVEAARAMELRHVVITSVTRDDLPDGGSSVFAEVIGKLHAAIEGVSVEVLTPDFKGCREDLDRVLDAGPDVFNHNLETVRRVQADVRPQAGYDRSLAVLKHAAARPGQIIVKSGLMVGLGETREELREAMRDLRAAGCQCLTLGQYLAPSRQHYPVQRFVSPEEFEEYRSWAEEDGFLAIASGPLVRSSYKADEMLRTVRSRRAEEG
jgi:lipoic acid synthetase